METFLYLEHKHREPKGVSNRTNVVHNWHFIWEGQCADSISVVYRESVTSNSAKWQVGACNEVLLAFIHSHISTFNKYELSFALARVFPGNWGYSGEQDEFHVHESPREGRMDKQAISGWDDKCCDGEGTGCHENMGRHQTQIQKPDIVTLN